VPAPKAPISTQTDIPEVGLYNSLYYDYQKFQAALNIIMDPGMKLTDSQVAELNDLPRVQGETKLNPSVISYNMINRRLERRKALLTEAFSNMQTALNKKISPAPAPSLAL
jgi:hypothetical protein